jgi:biotin transport system ATP-binding protein
MGDALFSLRGVSKKFPAAGTDRAEDFYALSNIHLEICEGECLLVAGSNGSGKTLLMRIIAGLLAPSEGEVIFRGRSLAKWGREFRRETGLVFQDAEAQIIGETLREDIAFGPANLGLSKTEIGERTEKALAAFGLAEKADSPPRRLSGGEKRRLALAGIIAMGCGTVIMDEPFANLDWPGVLQTLETIKDLKQEGKTLILLTHELEKALALADRLLILHRGIIRDQGPPGQVLDRLKKEWGVRDPRRNYRSIEDCSWLDS